ncbi:unnamed protein product [Heligmosomoides polygyrus]|uniref:Uncharacterized protein n=1 Tax=Heligmosomoides polygyrus TaxID=6339 RepID=A0A183G7E3_HELPZ|nr:unnamed protein product [Heligmosomoides polygyrus]
MKATRRREEGTGASGTVGAKATLACHRVNMIKRHSRKAEVKMKKMLEKKWLAPGDSRTLQKEGLPAVKQGECGWRRRLFRLLPLPILPVCAATADHLPHLPSRGTTSLNSPRHEHIILRRFLYFFPTSWHPDLLRPLLVIQHFPGCGELLVAARYPIDECPSEWAITNGLETDDGRTNG